MNTGNARRGAVLLRTGWCSERGLRRADGPGPGEAEAAPDFAPARGRWSPPGPSARIVLVRAPGAAPDRSDGHSARLRRHPGPLRPDQVHRPHRPGPVLGHHQLAGRGHLQLHQPPRHRRRTPDRLHRHLHQPHRQPRQRHRHRPRLTPGLAAPAAAHRHGPLPGLFTDAGPAAAPAFGAPRDRWLRTPAAPCAASH